MIPKTRCGKGGRQSVFACSGLILAIGFCYFQVAGHRFIEFDDALYIFNNSRVISGVSWTNLVWAFTNMEAANWHPLTWISYFIDRELFGPYPGGYLLMNVAWHMLASCALYLSCVKLTGSRLQAFVIALLFSVHPANVESVAWASSRKSILDAIFWFAGIWTYLRYLESRNRVFLLLTIVTHMLGLMSKSMHVTFPCTLWLVHLLRNWIQCPADAKWDRIKADFWAAFRLTAPMLLLSLYFCLITLHAQRPALSTLDGLPLSPRLINSIQSYWRYVPMFFFPREFAPFYPFFFEGLHFGLIIRPLLSILGLTVLLLWLGRRSPLVSIGWLWYLGTLVPVIGLVQVGSQSHADRYLYIPGVGLAMVWAGLFALLPRPRLARGFAVCCLITLAASLMIVTERQVAKWRNGITLFTHSLNVTGDCLTSVIALSSAYARGERFVEGLAFVQSKIAVAKNPANVARLLADQGAFHLALNQNESALRALEHAIELGAKTRNAYFLAALAAKKTHEMEKARDYLNKSKNVPQSGASEFDRQFFSLLMNSEFVDEFED